ncbi:lyase family protein [Nocardioides rotundus]|uniref:lyase family protein n=1 Tax=Nocardioides rotundus TaxID=1774216 RepID=UPI001CC12CBA|nr:lyase family protein [Nocardioides rotundus]
MSLFRSGAAAAAEVMTDEALLRRLVEVEQAWLTVRGYDARLGALLRDGDAERLGEQSAAGGNPVIPLVRLLRTRLEEAGAADAAAALHRGLTSQDVMDTALVLCARDGARRVLADLARQAGRCASLAEEHRASVRPGRTLTQHAVPTTFGLVAASWLTGLLDAADDLRSAVDRLPLQLGGAAGTLAGVSTQGDPATLRARLARELGLAEAPPWHTTRAPVTRLGDALVGCHDAWGRISNDVLLGSRPEVGELREGAGGGSSTMRHKQNPVLSVLVRSAAIAAPPLGATLHAAAAAQVDQRADGGWHAEWPALQELVRSSVIAGAQTADLLEGLRADRGRMAANADAAAEDLLAEARSLGVETTDPRAYLGEADAIIDAALARAKEDR